MSSSSEKKIIIFGSTGAIGTTLTQILSKRYPSWEIKAVTRNASKPSRLSGMQLPNVTMTEGDPFDESSVVKLSHDCDIVYCCIGFQKYEAKYWAKHWPIVVQNLLNAINKANSQSERIHNPQRLVFCDNLYAYGAGNTSPINPSTPTLPPSLKKGKPEVRSWMRQTFKSHMMEHPGTLTVVAGSDFFGPHVTQTSFLGDTMTGKIVKGETVLAIGSVNCIHDFCYGPDFAEALATASVHDKAYDCFWICPHTIHNKTMQEIANDIANKVYNGENQDALKRYLNKKGNVPVSTLDRTSLYVLSPFMSFAWHLIEMVRNWKLDYEVDDSEFCKTFNVKATDYDDALQSLVDFYKNRSE